MIAAKALFFRRKDNLCGLKKRPQGTQGDGRTYLVVREKGPIASMSHPQATWASASEIRAISFLTRVGCPCSCGIRAPQAARNGGFPVRCGALPHRDDAGSRGLPGPLFFCEAFCVYHHRGLVIMFNKNTCEPGAITTSMEGMPTSKKDEWSIIAFSARPLPQTTQAWQGHVLGGLTHLRPNVVTLHVTCPSPCRDDMCEEQRDLCGSDFNTADNRLADGRNVQKHGCYQLIRAQSRAGGSRAKGPTSALPRFLFTKW